MNQLATTTNDGRFDRRSRDIAVALAVYRLLETTLWKDFDGLSDAQTARIESQLSDIPWFPSSTEQMLERLDSLRQTPFDERWPNTVWPSDETFDAAQTFIEGLPSRMSCIPDIGLADDGEVNFLWKSDTLHVDLGFHEAGSYSFFARDRGGNEFLKDDLPSERGLPPEITELLTT